MTGAMGTKGWYPPWQRVTVLADPGVDVLGKPGEPGRHEQRADRTPGRTAGAEGRGDGGVTAGHMAMFVDPLHRRLTLLRAQTKLSEVQSLPWRNRGEPTGAHPTLHELGAGGAERAVPVEDQDRPAGVPVHRTAPRGHASTRRWRTSSSNMGSALVWAMMGRKFESPLQRGTMC